MIFRILGPLDVAGAPILGGLQQRALLALLVIRANEAVGRDELIDELWGANPPETAPHAVQVYVSRLRKLLAGAAAEIALDAGGYRLATDPRDVDARAFERMLDEGRRMLQAGNAATAVRALDAALGLWRGGALLDFRHEQFAQPEIARLEGLRLDAMEERFEARLALGAHAELVAELERLIVAEPLRERLSAQLMLALYRSGRQADALAVYRRAAHTLREQLGLAPGPALRELEAAILRQTPALTRAPSRLRLPAAVTPLVGRSAEADTIGELLRRDARLLTLMGPGGIGKTRLALEAAARAAPDFSDGVAFAGLAAVMDAELVVPTIARVLEAPEADGDPLEALAGHIGSRRLLVVVDNFEQVLDAGPALGWLLRACPQLELLVTSRTALRLYGEHTYDVPPLARQDAVALFSARARALRSDFTLSPAREAAVEAICHRLDDMPLAIELTAARSRSLDPEQMLAALPRTLDLPASGPRDAPDRQRTLRATMRWSCERLKPTQAAAFRALGVFAGGWQPDAAEAVAAAGAGELTALAEQSLIVRGPGSDRDRMLATIREYAVEQLEASGEADRTRLRHAEHFLALADAADRRLREGAQAATLAALEREHDNLRAALTWAGAHDRSLRLRLAGALGSFWAVRGHVAEGRGRLEEALAEPAADDSALARALAGAGILARIQSDQEAARPLLARAAELYRSLGDATGLVRALANLGFVEAVSGHRARARAAYEEALEAARRSGNLRDRLSALNCLADLGLHEEAWAEVERLSGEGLALARRLGDEEAVCVTLLNGAQAAFRADRPADALDGAIGAMELWASLGDEGSVAWCAELVALIAAGAQPTAAAGLLGAADALRRTAGVTLDGYERTTRERAERALGGVDGPHANALEAGRELDLEGAVAATRAVAASVTASARESG